MISYIQGITNKYKPSKVSFSITACDPDIKMGVLMKFESIMLN